MYRTYIGNREQLSLSEVKGIAKMKVLLAIFALALPLFAEPAEALCTSTEGDPCLSKAEVSGMNLHCFIAGKLSCPSPSCSFSGNPKTIREILHRRKPVL